MMYWSAGSGGKAGALIPRMAITLAYRERDACFYLQFCVKVISVVSELAVKWKPYTPLGNAFLFGYTSPSTSPHKKYGASYSF